MPKRKEHTPLELRILNILAVYPEISPSMLQPHIPGDKSQLHEALDKLITQDLVQQTHKVSRTSKRRQTHTILSLTPNGKKYLESANQIAVDTELGEGSNVDRTGS